MKGIVFTNFAEMVESSFGLDMLDRLLSTSQLQSGGAYTAVGTYDHREIVTLVTQLAAETGTPANELLKAFGRYLFSRFAVLYPQLFIGIDSAMEFLERVEEGIHVEVRKLYPDAELPTFTGKRSDADSLVMVYRSSRPFAALAEGLIAGCIEHFGEPIVVQMVDDSVNDDTRVQFTLTRQTEHGRIRAIPTSTRA